MRTANAKVLNSIWDFFGRKGGNAQRLWLMIDLFELSKEIRRRRCCSIQQQTPLIGIFIVYSLVFTHASPSHLNFHSLEVESVLWSSIWVFGVYFSPRVNLRDFHSFFLNRNHPKNSNHFDRNREIWLVPNTARICVQRRRVWDLRALPRTSHMFSWWKMTAKRKFMII